jgi:hypothetical protein
MGVLIMLQGRQPRQAIRWWAMGRMVFGLCLGFALVAGAIYWARTCLPDPNERGIEWLRREDAVVVQMKTLGRGDPFNLDEARITAPQLTLYGDGTLLAQVPSAGREQIFRTTALSNDEVRNLLEFIVDTGFFDFPYSLGSASDTLSETRFVFASELDRQNAVSGQPKQPLATALPDNLVALGEIAEFLDKLAVDPDRQWVEYTPPAVMVLAERTAPNVQTDTPEGCDPWPLPEIEIRTFVTRDGDIGTALVDGELADAVIATRPPITGRPYCQGGQRYTIAYRPVLPYEENFPEFDPPTP